MKIIIKKTTAILYGSSKKEKFIIKLTAPFILIKIYTNKHTMVTIKYIILSQNSRIMNI